MSEHAVTELIAAVARRMGADPSECGVHVNWGESEDRMKGFNQGYEDAERGVRTLARTEGDEQEDRWQHAYRRGYDEGWDLWFEHQEDDEEAER